MKVLHLVGGSLNGGAARAALTIHDGLIAAGIDSQVLTSAHGRGPHLRSLEATSAGKAMRSLRTVLDRAVKQRLSHAEAQSGAGFSPGVFGYPVSALVGQADILHLHWINDGGFRLPRFDALPKGTVWTFHDLWPMTGGCHYSFDCDRFQGSCGSCPALGSRRAHDASHYLQKQKARAVGKAVRGIATSTWLAEQAQASTVFGQARVDVIPNAVDTAALAPIPRALARQALDLDPNRRIVLTGHASKAYQKGSDLLAAAWRQLAGMRDDTDLIGFGNIDADLAGQYHRHFGFLADLVSLRLLYAAADVFAFPSRTEAFGRTLIEAMACGTPVVGFAGSGGPDDIITEGRTGRLVPAEDTAAFAQALNNVLDGGDVWQDACRDRAVSVYAMPVVARAHIATYRDVLG